jgi:aminopeptidase
VDVIQVGARQAVCNCVKVRSGERVVITTDRQTERLADAIGAEAGQVGAIVDMFIMEDFGPRPEDGSSPLRFPGKIDDALRQAQVSFYIAASKPGELHSFRIPMTRRVEEYRVRHAHMPNFTEEMMGTGMAADYGEIQRISREVYEIVRQARHIQVTTPAGTDITATFDLTIKWVVSDGDITPEQWGNLPDGEVFTAPVDAVGTVVVDGCLGDFFSAKYGDLGATPLSYELENGRCVRGSVRCANGVLRREFEVYTFETDENSDRLGEFAIGTNVGLTRLIGNILQDEKFPGMHLALGHPHPKMTGADWESKAHNDGILRTPTIVVGDRRIMEAGAFTI